MNKFGPYIKAFRRRKGITMRSLCEAIGYDVLEWYKIEACRRIPDLDLSIQDKIASFLEMDDNNRSTMLTLIEENQSMHIPPLTEKEIIGHLPIFHKFKTPSQAELFINDVKNHLE